MSTHMAGEPHNAWFWPQVQAPPVHVAPDGQGVQPPQCSAVPPVGDTHAPSVHWSSPAGQSPQPPLVQPWSAPHTMSQLPQCAAFEATHCPPHESKPPLQAHCPLLQVCPIAQA